MLAHAKFIMVGGVASALVLGTSIAEAQETAPPPPNALPAPPPPSTPPPATSNTSTNNSANANASANNNANTNATDDTGKKIRIGADLELGLPIGNLSDAAGFGFGALGRFEYRVLEKLSVTGRAGFVYHLDSEPAPGFNTGIAYIPLRGGVKYMLMNANDGLYVAGEAGLNLIFARIDGTFFGQKISSSDSEFRFGILPMIGYQLDKLDFRLGLNFLDITDPGDFMVLAANVGYTFAEF